MQAFNVSMQPGQRSGKGIALVDQNGECARQLHEGVY